MKGLPRTMRGGAGCAGSRSARTHFHHASANIGMNFIVLGAGAIGCYVGGRLAHGQPVCLVGRPHALEPIAQHGLKGHWTWTVFDCTGLR